jgi:hypothetical protein
MGEAIVLMMLLWIFGLVGGVVLGKLTWSPPGQKKW